MEQRIISRGDVYWVTVDDSVGGEQQTGRPALVVSAKAAGELNGTHTVAYLTTGGTASPFMPQVMVNRRKNRVLCNQIRTLDQSRFTSYLCTLTNDEMRRVTGALAGALCIPNYPGAVAESEESAESTEELRTELEMYKRMYERVLDQLVELRIEVDTAKRMVFVEDAVVEEPSEEPEPEEAEPPKIMKKTVELNSCDMNDLIDIGVNEDVAVRLIEGRPWKRVEEIRTVDGLTSMMYAVLSHVFTVEAEAEVEVPEVPTVKAVREYTWEEFKTLPESTQLLYLDYRRNTLGEKESDIARSFDVKAQAWYNFTNKHPALLRNGKKPQKTTTAEVVAVPDGAMVNINTATAKELSEKLGMPMKDAYSITGHRKKHGLFGDIEELILVNRFTKNKVEMYRDHICVVDAVEDVVVVEEPPQKITPAPVVKVNINTASQYELQQAGFTKAQAAKIRYSRNKDGPFREIEDLLEIDGIKKKDIRKLRDVLEV